MDKAELFALFGEFDDRRAVALKEPNLYDRYNEIDDLLSELLNRLAEAAKMED